MRGSALRAVQVPAPPGRSFLLAWAVNCGLPKSSNSGAGFCLTTGSAVLDRGLRTYPAIKSPEASRKVGSSIGSCTMCIRKWLVGVVFVFGGVGQVNAESLTFDFDSGPGPNFRVYDGSDGLYTVDTDGPNVRISKPSDDGTFRPTGGINAGIRSYFSMHGDFTITVDFALNDFPPADVKEINASSMTVFSQEGTLSVLRLRVGELNLIEMYGKPSGASGTTSSTLNNGHYRLERTGSTVTGLFAPAGSTSFTSVARALVLRKLW